MYMMYYALVGEETKPMHMNLDRELVTRVDEFRWKNRLASRTAAIEWLLRFALAQKPKVEK